MITLKEVNGWKLVTFEGAGSSYKIINGNKCHYEYQQRASALKRFEQITKAI